FVRCANGAEKVSPGGGVRFAASWYLMGFRLAASYALQRVCTERVPPARRSGVKRLKLELFAARTGYE
ncbi:hypothetical protein, partial [Pantoea agglomerans]|uniref:hypothetical protein n=1 Tax=Enterobacter agglomerans TaxID=549 RepID=UPI003C7CEC31